MRRPTVKSRARAKPRRGRPRDPQRHEAILEATRQLILERGYTSVTFDAVARRAGVSRMTVHKWWRHRVELVEEALFPDYSDLPPPDTGSFEEDLTLLVDEIVDRMTQPLLVWGMPALRAELNANRHLWPHTASRYGTPSHTRWQEVFDRAVKRGEIPKGVDAVAAMLVVLGAIEAFSQNRPVVVPPRKMTSYLVSLLLRGALEPRENRPSAKSKRA